MSGAAIGAIQTSQVKPFFGGSGRTVGPYSCTNDWRIRSSESPRFTRSATSFCMALAVSHGPEKAPPVWLQVPAVSLQPPHMHMTFLERVLARSELSARAAGAKTENRNAKDPTTVMSARCLWIFSRLFERRRQSGDWRSQERRAS